MPALLPVSPSRSRVVYRGVRFVQSGASRHGHRPPGIFFHDSPIDPVDWPISFSTTLPQPQVVCPCSTPSSHHSSHAEPHGEGFQPSSNFPRGMHPRRPDHHVREPSRQQHLFPQLPRGSLRRTTSTSTTAPTHSQSTPRSASGSQLCSPRPPCGRGGWRSRRGRCACWRMCRTKRPSVLSAPVGFGDLGREERGWMGGDRDVRCCQSHPAPVRCRRYQSSPRAAPTPSPTARRGASCSGARVRRIRTFRAVLGAQCKRL